MNFIYEKKLNNNFGYKYIAGIDEAGRGPLAGPVAAGCFMFLNYDVPKNIRYKIKDSKLLSEKARMELFNIFYEWKQKGLVDFAVSFVMPSTIDKINIQNATVLAMRRSFFKMQIKPDYVIVDKISYKKRILPCDYETKIKADKIVISCACASIVGKVYRDLSMIKQHQKYPNYGFVSNKGYPTKLHYVSIKKYGITPIHRKSFRLI